MRVVDPGADLPHHDHDLERELELQKYVKDARGVITYPQSAVDRARLDKEREDALHLGAPRPACDVALDAPSMDPAGIFRELCEYALTWVGIGA